MNQPTQALEHAIVRQYCKALRMPVIGTNFVRLSEQAVKEQTGREEPCRRRPGQHPAPTAPRPTQDDHHSQRQQQPLQLGRSAING